jgi:hypothetical protein
VQLRGVSSALRVGGPTNAGRIDSLFAAGPLWFAVTTFTESTVFPFDRRGPLGHPATINGWASGGDGGVLVWTDPAGIVWASTVDARGPGAPIRIGRGDRNVRPAIAADGSGGAVVARIDEHGDTVFTRVDLRAGRATDSDRLVTRQPPHLVWRRGAYVFANDELRVGLVSPDGVLVALTLAAAAAAPHDVRLARTRSGAALAYTRSGLAEGIDADRVVVRRVAFP